MNNVEVHNLCYHVEITYLKYSKQKKQSLVQVPLGLDAGSRGLNILSYFSNQLKYCI